MREAIDWPIDIGGDGVLGEGAHQEGHLQILAPEVPGDEGWEEEAEEWADYRVVSETKIFVLYYNTDIRQNK